MNRRNFLKTLSVLLGIAFVPMFQTQWVRRYKRLPPPALRIEGKSWSHPRLEFEWVRVGKMMYGVPK